MQTHGEPRTGKFSPARQIQQGGDLLAPYGRCIACAQPLDDQRRRALKIREDTQLSCWYCVVSPTTDPTTPVLA